MVVVKRFGVGALRMICLWTSTASAPQRRSCCTHAQTCTSTVTMTPAGNILPVYCTKRLRQLQWRKYDPILIHEVHVGCFSGCGPVFDVQQVRCVECRMLCVVPLLYHVCQAVLLLRFTLLLDNYSTCF